MEEYIQVCVLPKSHLGEDQGVDFERFFLDNYGFKVKYIDTILYSEKDQVYPDILFYINEEEINRFAIPRFFMGIEWFEEYVDQYPERYSKELIVKYYIH